MTGPAGTGTQVPSGRRWRALAAVCLAQAMLMIDVTVVLVALPELGRDLHASLSDAQLVVDAYALTLATFLLNLGAMADRLGRRRVFAAGLILFAAASAGCGAAPSATVLIAARAVQGVGGAVLLATGLAILGHEFPEPAERAKAIGIFGAVFGSSIAIGPLAGGALIDALDWRWIFFVNLPIAAIALWLTRRSVSEFKDPSPRSVDLPGQALFALSVATVLIGLIRGQAWGWGSPRTLACLAVSVLAAAAFTLVERSRREAMFDFALLANRSFTGASVAASTTSASLFGMFVYLTIVMQIVDRLSPLQTGLRLLPVTVIAFIAAAAAGSWSERISPRLVLTAALTCSTGGLAWMTVWQSGHSWSTMLPGLLLVGIGFGIANPTVAAVTLREAPPDRSATAVGMNSTFRQVGIAAGVAVLGAVLEHHLAHTAAAGITGAGRARLTPAARAAVDPLLIAGLHRVFIAGAIIAGIGGALTCALVRTRAPSPEPATTTVADALDPSAPAPAPR